MTQWDAPAVVVVIGALGTMLVTVIASIFAGLMAWSARVKTQEVIQKSDVVIAKAAEIHSATNSNLAKVTEALNIANEKIAGLQALVALMVDAKAIADRAADKTLTRRASDALGAASAPIPVEIVNQPVATNSEP